MSDLLRTLAFAFRRRGADALPGSELRHLLAFDLRWFAPADAKRFVERALEVGALVQEGEAVRPAFDVAAIEVPVNFRPSLAVLDEEAPHAMPAPRAPAAHPARQAEPQASPQPLPPPSAPSPVERAAEDERRRRGLLIDLEAARLIVRRRAGEDVAQAAAEMEARLLAGSAAGAPSRRAAP